MKKLLIDIDSGYLYGFPKEVPSHFLNDDLSYKDYQDVRKWIIEQTGGKEPLFIREIVRD